MDLKYAYIRDSKTLHFNPSSVGSKEVTSLPVPITLLWIQTSKANSIQVIPFHALFVPSRSSFEALSIIQSAIYLAESSLYSQERIRAIAALQGESLMDRKRGTGRAASISAPGVEVGIRDCPP